MIKSLQKKKDALGQRAPEEKASQAMVDFASETWRFQQALTSCLGAMDPVDADRLTNQWLWYMRKAQAVMDEAHLKIVDVTGQSFDVGMAVTPLNLEDFLERPDAVFRVAQMVEPIVMENGQVRKTGAVMLAEELEEP